MKNNILAKKLNWFVISLTLVPLSFVLYYILVFGFTPDHSGGVVFTLFCMSFSDFFFSRRNYDYYVLTALSYSSTAIVGVIIMTLFSQLWMLLFVMFGMHIAKILTSRLNDDGIKVYEEIDRQENEQKGLQKLIATPAQRDMNSKNIKDTILFFIAIIVLYFAYLHVADRYEQMQELEKHRSSVK